MTSATLLRGRTARAVVILVLAVTAAAMTGLRSDEIDAVTFSFAPISTSGSGLHHGDLNGDGKPGLGPHPRDFSITAVVQRRQLSGDVVKPFSLYPGARGDLALTVHNSTNQPVDVRTLTVAAGNASSGCPAQHLEVGSFSGSLVVPRQSTGTVLVPIRLAGAAPNDCKTVGFPLAITGTGTKVSR